MLHILYAEVIIIERCIYMSLVVQESDYVYVCFIFYLVFLTALKRVRINSILYPTSILQLWLQQCFLPIQMLQIGIHCTKIRNTRILHHIDMKYPIINVNALHPSIQDDHNIFPFPYNQ